MGEEEVKDKEEEEEGEKKHNSCCNQSMQKHPFQLPQESSSPRGASLLMHVFGSRGGGGECCWCSVSECKRRHVQRERDDDGSSGGEQSARKTDEDRFAPLGSLRGGGQERDAFKSWKEGGICCTVNFQY